MGLRFTPALIVVFLCMCFSNALATPESFETVASPVPVISGRDMGTMMSDYCEAKAAAKIALLRRKYPVAKFVKAAPSIRKALMDAYMMPPASAVPETALLRTMTLDGIDVEFRLLKTRPGVYSTALVYKPSKADGDIPPKGCPAILMLPGHGDPAWSQGVQERCLSFAKRGYLVMFVEPFGQMERGDNSLWNESHGSQSMAFLLTTGQSLMGLIMSDHQAELAYLCSRSDVDPKKIGVTGVSMGGSHTFWMCAIDDRIGAGAGVGIAPIARPVWALRHHCLCDTPFGLFDVADDDIIRALSAPRAFMQLYPDSERPVTDDGMKAFTDGKFSYEELLTKHRLIGDQIARFNPFTREVYHLLGADDKHAITVIPGPHDMNAPMREMIAGWFGCFLRGETDTSTRPEPPLDAMKWQDAIHILSHWPDGNRPKDMLGPTAYVQRETSKLIAKLPKAPADLRSWKKMRGKLGSSTAKPLSVAPKTDSAQVVDLGCLSFEGTRVRKLIVRPEPGIELPMLLFRPEGKADSPVNLTVLLHPDGTKATALSDARSQLIKAGKWVLCVDLRGMGETRSRRESSGYLGLRDGDTSIAALKLGETIAGWWTRDLLFAVDAARSVIGIKTTVTVRGDRETGLVAILAAGQSDSINGVETTQLLASYYSADGYGLPFAYANENNDKSVRERKLGGYGSMVPCIPNMLKCADIPQLAAMVAPKSLTIDRPVWASGNPVPKSELDEAFAWTKQIYDLYGKRAALRITEGS